METRSFGGTGVKVPVVGMGTWEMESSPRRAVEALETGLSLGMTHIDTAEMYGDGKVERLVASAIQEWREMIFLVSKVLPENGSYAGTIAACERSLKNLGTDYLDAYLLHWPGKNPLGETFRAFEKLQADGKIRAFGVSNFDVPHLEAAARVVDPRKIACNQVLYHLGERAIEERVRPWCEPRSISIVAYSPLAQGNLPGPSSPAFRVLNQVARACGHTPRQVALRFLLQKGADFVIPKATSPEHLEENKDAGNFTLTRQEMDRIDEAFPMLPQEELPVL